MKSNMDELYTRNFAMAKAAEDELFAERHDPSCAYELPEKWDREPFPLPEGLHQTQQMYVLRDGDRVIGYFPRREDAEQRLLVDERVDGKAWVTVR